MTHPQYDAEVFYHWLTVPVRFRDLDPLNHVNNAIFSTFYEEARIAFIAEVPALEVKLNNGFSFVLANIEIDFIYPVVYPADLLVGTGITRIGNSSISSFQAVYTAKDKKLVSTAEAHGVWFDLENQKPTEVPEIKGLEKFMV